MKTLKQLIPFGVAFGLVVGSSILARYLFTKGVISYEIDLAITIAVPLIIMAYFVYLAWKESKEDKKNGL